jgi:predicted RNA-binding protein with PUA-like domain
MSNLNNSNSKNKLQQQVRTWMFQANPNKYRIEDSIRIEDEEYWNLNQHSKKIHKGDRVLVWISGQEAGIYAIGTVATEPVMMPDSPKGLTYWTKSSDGQRLKPRVLVKYKMKLYDTPLLKKFLQCDPALWDLRIIQFPRGTNFPVTEEEWKAIKVWLDSKKN